jgi:hypothetical protein
VIGYQSSVISYQFRQRIHLLSGESIGNLENAFRHASGLPINNQVSEAARMLQWAHRAALFLGVSYWSLITGH